MTVVAKTSLTALMITMPLMALANLEESKKAAKAYETCILDKLSFYTVKPTEILCVEELNYYLTTVPEAHREKVKATVLSIYQDIDLNKQGE